MSTHVTENIPAKFLADAIYSDSTLRGHVVVSYDTPNKKIIRAKIPPDQVAWFLTQAPASARLSLSCSTYAGKNILPNLVDAKVVSVELDLRHRDDIQTSTQLFEMLCWSLDKQRIPLPSAIAFEPSTALVLWILERPIELLDLGWLSALESGLAKALTSFGARTLAQSAMRSIPVPSNAAFFGSSVRLVGRGPLPTINKERLLRAVGDNVPVHQYGHYVASCEIIEELNSLLFFRFMDASRRPDLYSAWMSAYAAAASAFTDALDLKEIARSVAETLRNAAWPSIRQESPAPELPTYESYVDRISRYLRDASILFGERSFYSTADEGWARAAASALSVSQQEINELQLRHLLPGTLRRHSAGYFCIPKRWPIGKEDFVPIQRLLLRAA